MNKTHIITLLIALLATSWLQAEPSKTEDTQAVLTQNEDGLELKDAPLNDIFQYLAKQAGKQFFHNKLIDGENFLVTGHLNEGEPLTQMEELAFVYGLTLYEKKETVYILDKSQAGNVPLTELYYQLKYLRPTDIEQIKALIRPFLSIGRSSRVGVNFEPKTNTLIIVDTEHQLEKVEAFLHKIDRPKGQIVVDVKILKVNSNDGRYRGVDWSSTLGANGLPFSLTQSLQDLFNLKDNSITTEATVGGTENGLSIESIETATAPLVLSPFQVRGVLQALDENGISQALSSPTLITEDNEAAAISIIDRIPIITSTVSSITGGAQTITDEVRYTIDDADPTITAGADKTREIGITISIVPTSLPDGTIRMTLRPRSAQITELIEGPSQNNYPRVTEATVSSIARVPDGHSLLVGGFYEETQTDDSNSVPLLGKIPGLRFLFNSESDTKRRSSLVFIVTPRTYNPAYDYSSDREYNKTYDRLNPKKPHFKSLHQQEQEAKLLQPKWYEQLAPSRRKKSGPKKR